MSTILLTFFHFLWMTLVFQNSQSIGDIVISETVQRDASGCGDFALSGAVGGPWPSASTRL